MVGRPDELSLQRQLKRLSDCNHLDIQLHLTMHEPVFQKRMETDTIELFVETEINVDFAKLVDYIEAGLLYTDSSQLFNQGRLFLDSLVGVFDFEREYRKVRSAIKTDSHRSFPLKVNNLKEILIGKIVEFALFAPVCSLRLADETIEAVFEKGSKTASQYFRIGYCRKTARLALILVSNFAFRFLVITHR